MRSLFILLLMFYYSFAGVAQSNEMSSKNYFTGSYLSLDTKEYVITHSSERLFFFDPQTLDFRALYPKSEGTFIAYNSLFKNASSQQEMTIEFSNKEDKKLISIKSDKETHKAFKSDAYSEEQISFLSDSIEIKGSLLLPRTTSKVPAVVLVHGSGSQDRNGYVSYIRLVANRLVNRGIAVLIYDKRGCGYSEGNWKSASFEDLALDALSGYEFLKNRKEIDSEQIGIGGSSQAGWVISKAVNIDTAIPFVFCISGAGMGISAAEQNIYNIQTELKYLGASQPIIDACKASWMSLFKYVDTQDKDSQRQLDNLVDGIKNTDWLRFFPPKSADFILNNKEHWFEALEINYDPLEVWKKYNGDIFAVFGELDASTPVDMVVERFQEATKLKTKPPTIRVYDKSSHLVLDASIKSDSEFENLKNFSPYFFEDLTNWILYQTNEQSKEISQVLEVEREWLQSYENKDMGVMRGILDDNFIITYPSGFQMDKKTSLDALLLDTSCRNMKLYTTVTTARQNHNTVILRGIVTTKCQNGLKNFVQRQRYTDTYFKVGNNWKVIASHLSNY